MVDVGRKRPTVRTNQVFPRLLPLCHVVAPAEVAVDFGRDDSARRIRMEANASTKDDVTGVEMGPIDLLEKTGGKPGRYER